MDTVAEGSSAVSDTRATWKKSRRAIVRRISNRLFEDRVKGEGQKLAVERDDVQPCDDS